MSTELTTPKNNISSGLSIFDTGSFDHMAMIAAKLAASSLIPESLRATKDGNKMIDLPHEQVAANCFRIVEQARRWGMSPFAVVDCASVVHGKLMWEGKLIHAALEATMGIRLDYTYSGEGLNRKVTVIGKYPNEEKERTVEGTVADWKTDQWKPTAYDQRLAYRGSREWSRRHAPGAILGVYTADEFEEDVADKAMRNASGRVIPKENPYEEKKPASTEESPKAAKKGKAKAEEPAAETPAQDTVVIPSRKVMYNALKDACFAAEVSPQTAEAKFRKAGLIPEGKTLAETSDEELFVVYEERLNILPPKAAQPEQKEEPKGEEAP